LFKVERQVRVVEGAHNLWLHVPGIALLSGVGARQLMDLLLWRYDDPFLAQQDLGQVRAPLEE
jgi:hypothetical protein